MSTAKMLNISSYLFTTIPESELETLRAELREMTANLDLKGTILLGTEGINQFLSGTPENMAKMKAFYAQHRYFSEAEFKDSYSEKQPFNRMLVKIKKEIVTLGVDGIDPQHKPAPYIKPTELKKWYDEGKDMIVLDTRNQFEIRLGAFKNAVDLKIDKFRDFTAALEDFVKKNKDKTIVTYCTGGIRCEKGAPLMEKMGFSNVYQLEGGILKYFEEVGGDYWEGECFVFDQRVAVNCALEETHTLQCYACLNPITVAEQESCQGLCPYCKDDNVGIQIDQRAAA